MGGIEKGDPEAEVVFGDNEPRRHRSMSTYQVQLYLSNFVPMPWLKKTVMIFNPVICAHIVRYCIVHTVKQRHLKPLERGIQ